MCVTSGARLLVGCLVAAGCRAAFGVPGFQALALWDAALESELRLVGMRTELSAAYAADGFARAGGGAGVVITTTGPGAVIGAAGLAESRLSFVPVVNIATQVPRAVLGGGRGGIHELAAQSEILAASAKWHALAREPDELPELVAQAVAAALTAPQGPAVLEVPCDLLTATTDAAPSPFEPPAPRAPAPQELAAAAALLDAAAAPALLAGGGVLRSGAAAALAALAERLDAPVVTTFMGKGAIAADHPLFAGSASYEPAVLELLAGSDVVLALGTELGETVTNGWTLELQGRLIQCDVRAEHIGRTYPGALPLHGDARLALEALAARVPPRRRDGAERAGAVRARLDAQPRQEALELLRTIRAVMPRDAVVVWDMTIAAYAAAPFFPVYEPDTWLYPLGSGALGYAWPAALGVKLARPDRDVLAVHGDGGILYGAAELLTAVQEAIAAKLLVIDDGGYGILRLIQERSFGRTTGVELLAPDFPAMGAALHVPVHQGRLEEALRAALAEPGPALVHLPQALRTLERTT